LIGSELEYQMQPELGAPDCRLQTELGVPDCRLNLEYQMQPLTDNLGKS
jgi:hypothetical protein